MSYELGKVPHILVGSEHLKNLPELVQSLSGESVVFIVDSAVAKGDYFKALQGFGLPMSTFVMPASEPCVATVNAAVEIARQQPQTVVVGIGGGSALDTAKQVAAVIASDKPIEHYLLCANPWYGRRPIIAIPTTSGTGSEVTRTCIVTNAEGRKMWTWGDELLPDIVILDPVATVSMPEWVTVSTGLDAFVHALEAATGQRRNMISRGLALQAIRLIFYNLHVAVTEPQNLEARQAMQEAAMLAGMAIDNCGTGIAHCIGHALGTLYHIPHGVAVTLALQASFDWNIEGGEIPYREVSEIFGVYVKAMPITYRELLHKLKFADVVKPEFDLDAEDIAKMMAAPENLPMLTNNWRFADEKDRLRACTPHRKSME